MLDKKERRFIRGVWFVYEFYLSNSFSVSL